MQKQKTVTLENIKQGAINDLFMIDIDPPVSNFVLRHKDGTFALFDADGEKWKYIAIKEIAEYLKSAMPELSVLY